jgi:hypothetical protein
VIAVPQDDNNIPADLAQLDGDDPRLIQPGDLADGLAAAVGAAVGRSVLDRMIFIEGARHMAPSILKGKTDAEVVSWIAKQVDLGKGGGPKGSAYEPWDKLVHESRHRGEKLLLHARQNVALTDGTIVDKFGNVLSEVQQKATFDAAYIRYTLTQLPDGVVIHVPKDFPLPPDLLNEPRVIRSGPSMRDLDRGLVNASKQGPASMAGAAAKAGVYGALIGAGVEGLIGGYHVLVKHDRIWEHVGGDLLWNGAITSGLSAAGGVMVTAGLAALGVTGVWVPILVSIPVGIAVGKAVRAVREPVSQIVSVVWHDLPRTPLHDLVPTPMRELVPTPMRGLMPAPLLALVLPLALQASVPIPTMASAITGAIGGAYILKGRSSPAHGN